MRRSVGGANEKEKLEQALAIFTELKMPRERDAVQEEMERGARGQGLGARVEGPSASTETAGPSARTEVLGRDDSFVI